MQLLTANTVMIGTTSSKIAQPIFFCFSKINFIKNKIFINKNGYIWAIRRCSIVKNPTKNTIKKKTIICPKKRYLYDFFMNNKIIEIKNPPKKIK